MRVEGRLCYWLSSPFPPITCVPPHHKLRRRTSGSAGGSACGSADGKQRGQEGAGVEPSSGSRAAAALAAACTRPPARGSGAHRSVLVLDVQPRQANPFKARKRTPHLHIILAKFAPYGT